MSMIPQFWYKSFSMSDIWTVLDMLGICKMNLFKYFFRLYLVNYKRMMVTYFIWILCTLHSMFSGGI